METGKLYTKMKRVVIR